MKNRQFSCTTTQCAWVFRRREKSLGKVFQVECRNDGAEALKRQTRERRISGRLGGEGSYETNGKLPRGPTLRAQPAQLMSEKIERDLCRQQIIEGESAVELTGDR
eukprot:Pompholyxophrys_punicea_v1_NODE_587_length_1640_cov_6.484868.p3 type:complete len:106 gc:universal NODE_587_length_1640_cov_6.484868:968-651(-)